MNKYTLYKIKNTGQIYMRVSTLPTIDGFVNVFYREKTQMNGHTLYKINNTESYKFGF